jgi:hypothetical protein
LGAQTDARIVIDNLRTIGSATWASAIIARVSSAGAVSLGRIYIARPAEELRPTNPPFRVAYHLLPWLATGALLVSVVLGFWLGVWKGKHSAGRASLRRNGVEDVGGKG